MLVHDREVDAQIEGDLSEPLVIASRLAIASAVRKLWISVIFAQVGAKRCAGRFAVNGLFQRVATLGELRQGPQRLLKICHGFAVCRASGCPGSGLSAVGQGLVPRRTPHGVVGQVVYLLSQPLGRMSLNGLDNLGVQYPPPLLEQTVVCHLVGQGVLERKTRARGTAGSRTGARPLAGVQGRGTGPPRAVRQWPVTKGQGHLCTDDRRGLGGGVSPQAASGRFVTPATPLPLRHLIRRQCLCQAIGSGFAQQYPRFHQGAHALFQEERIALGACDQQLFQGL